MGESNQLYAFNAANTRRIAHVVRRVENDPRGTTGGAFDPWSNPYAHTIYAVNKTGGTIPPCSVVMIKKGQAYEGRWLSHVYKAAKSQWCREWGITGYQEIESGDPLAVHFDVGLATYTPNSLGDPEPGQMWGPADDSFKMRQNYPGFICLGVHDTTENLAWFRAVWPTEYLCKPDASISAGGTGCVSIYAGSLTSGDVIRDCTTGTIAGEEDTLWNTKAKALAAPVTAGTWCMLSYLHGQPYVGPWECS